MVPSMLCRQALQASPDWHMRKTAAACSAGRQAGTGDANAAAGLKYNMFGSQVGCLLYLWKKQQICHGCSVSPDEDGGLLEEGNLVVQVQALQVHNLHHTVGPLLQDARLHLSCINRCRPALYDRFTIVTLTGF